MPNRLLLAAVAGLFKTFVKTGGPEPPWEPASIRSVLLLNTTALGDTLLTTPALRAIRHALPAARMTALVSPPAKSVLLHNPHIDHLMDHPGRIRLLDVPPLLRLIRELRREPYDLAVILDGNDPDAVPLAWLSGARHRWGWDGSQLAFLLTRPMDFNQPGRHHIAIWRDELAAAGIPFQGMEMEVGLSEDEEAEGRKRREAWSQPVIGLHPFAAKLRDKPWPWERVIALGQTLSEAGFLPLLFGGQKEAEAAERGVRASGGKMASVAGKLTLRQTMALMKQCAVFITLDSGPMHMAQALGVPTVALFGPSDPRETGPLRNAVVLREPFECSPCGRRPCPFDVACMKAISVADVVNATLALVGPADGSAHSGDTQAAANLP
jgi:heptosyltransferase-2